MRTASSLNLLVAATLWASVNCPVGASIRVEKWNGSAWDDVPATHYTISASPGKVTFNSSESCGKFRVYTDPLDNLGGRWH